MGTSETEGGTGSAPPMRRAVAMFATVFLALAVIALLAWFVVR